MQYFLEFCIVSFSALLITFSRLVSKNPPAILNVYQRPNGYFWLKFAFMYAILSFRKLVQKLKQKKKTYNAAQVYTDLDKPQKLSQHQNAIDAVYFNGASHKGDYLVVGTARRKDNLVDGFLYLLVESSKLGLLETPKLPSTSLYKTDDNEEYAAEGIQITPMVPMKKWKIQYEGKMKRHENPTELVDVKLEAEWHSTLPYFNFDTDMDPRCMAKSMALEKFSRDYFENLKMNHQTHYEQHGDITGTATINGHTHNFNINALRDHSFGLQREWRNFHRYGLHFFTTERGDRFNVGMICLPISFSCLTVGYVYSAWDKKIYPVKSCDLQLYQHGEDGNPPLDYAFSFEAGNKHYTVQVNVIHSPHFYISKDWECKIVERLCTFDVNGVKGWGAAEWQYRNVEEKNVAETLVSVPIIVKQ